MSDRTSPSSSWDRLAAVAAVAVVGAVAGLGSVRAMVHAADLGYTPMDRAIVKQLKTDGDWNRFNQHFSGMSQTNAMREALRASRTGAVRLDDADILRLVSGMRAIVQRGSPSLCVAIANGKTSAGTQDEIRRVAQTLDSATLQRYAAASAHATMAEIRGLPAGETLSDQQMGMALRAFMDNMPSEVAARFAKIGASSDAVRGADACWWTQTLFDAISQTPEYGVPFARTMLASAPAN